MICLNNLAKIVMVIDTYWVMITYIEDTQRCKQVEADIVIARWYCTQAKLSNGKQ